MRGDPLPVGPEAYIIWGWRSFADKIINTQLGTVSWKGVRQGKSPET